jgi:hypothetical protein
MQIMKYLSPVICLIIFLTSINEVQAQTLPLPEEVGNFFGIYMCKSLVETNSMDNDKIMEQFTEDLITKYGEEKTLILIDKMDFTGENLSNDNYTLNIMKGVFNHIINNDPCFKVFIKEIF